MILVFSVFYIIVFGLSGSQLNKLRVCMCNNGIIFTNISLLRYICRMLKVRHIQQNHGKQSAIVFTLIASYLFVRWHPYRRKKQTKSNTFQFNFDGVLFWRYFAFKHISFRFISSIVEELVQWTRTGCGKVCRNSICVVNRNGVCSVYVWEL